MNQIDDGGAAFPILRSDQAGMTLRDWFAGQAINDVHREFFKGVDDGVYKMPADWRIGVASDAYKLADAMITARNQTTP